MREDTLISILEANKLMRSADEVAAFEEALAELTKNPHSKYLRELHLVLDDRCQYQEVMFSLLHFLESFDVKEQLQAFIDVVPKLIVSAPEWTKIIHYRILNDNLICDLYIHMLNSVDSPSRNIIYELLEEIIEERQTVNA